MKFNLLNFIKMSLAVAVVLVVLIAAQEGAEARKRNKKHSGSKRKLKGNKRHRRRHSSRDDDAIMDEETRRVAELMANIRESRLSRRIAPPVHTVDEWTDAAMDVGSAFAEQKLKIEHSASGKFGFHIRPKNIFGKVVHVLDSNRQHHYGCSDVISNTEEIPRGEPWIALIKRGKCYFFNKISLGENYNASAVVVYDDTEGDIKVMNTIGTEVVSLMINLKDGSKIADLVDSGVKVYANITVGRHHVNDGRFEQLSSVESDVTPGGTGSGRHLVPHLSFILFFIAFLFVRNS